MFFILKICPKRTMVMKNHCFVEDLMPLCWVLFDFLLSSFFKGLLIELYIYNTLQYIFEIDIWSVTNKIALETRWMLKYCRIRYPNHEYILITIVKKNLISSQYQVKISINFHFYYQT
jgi:hypothetical protein